MHDDGHVWKVASHALEMGRTLDFNVVGRVAGQAHVELDGVDPEVTTLLVERVGELLVVRAPEERVELHQASPDLLPLLLNGVLTILDTLAGGFNPTGQDAPLRLHALQPILHPAPLVPL